MAVNLNKKPLRQPISQKKKEAPANFSLQDMYEAVKAFREKNEKMLAESPTS
jgi:hypothetical protein